uniref:Uncharacterized protein n=1 Tax=Setaria italica TaxID=4555 RepID=K3XNY1_SETIT
MQSSKANREIERRLAVARTERCGFHRFPHSEKASRSVLVHNSAYHLPWITGWKQKHAAVQRCMYGSDPLLRDLHE